MASLTRKAQGRTDGSPAGLDEARFREITGPSIHHARCISSARENAATDRK
jgi:hypothetical protein